MKKFLAAIFFLSILIGKMPAVEWDAITRQQQKALLYELGENYFLTGSCMEAAITVSRDKKFVYFEIQCTKKKGLVFL